MTKHPPDSHCFHCGLPVPGPNPDQAPPPKLEVDGEQREFCCPGCHAVCKAIVDAGLDDYYHFRNDDLAANRGQVPEFLQHLDIYDRPEMQKEFVRDGGPWREASLLLEDIRCPACLWLNERHLRSLPGVIDVSLDDTSHRARVRWLPEQIQLSEILAAIAAIGYLAHPYDIARDQELRDSRRRRSSERLIYAGLVGMMVMNFSIASYLMPLTNADGDLALWVVIGRWTSVLMSLSLLAYPGQEFFVSAWRDLKHRRMGMDLPIVLGLSAAFLGSLTTTISGHGEVYFDSIAMFVFLLLLARRWELRGKVRAGNQLDRLSRATPAIARRLDADGGTQQVPALDLEVGDRIRLLPGETLPVDGRLLDGLSSFDESLLTGEADPVLHRPGDTLVGGAVNGDQAVMIEVLRPLQASAISEIQRLVRQGLEQRPRYARLAERVARWFVAVLLLIAVATAAFWLWYDPQHWLANTIAVLIVTCPCALALATPVSLAVSAGRFIHLGVLPLRMGALDALALTDTLAFDKTGTLTQGRPAITTVEAVGALDRQAILDIAATIATVSEHPLARALRREGNAGERQVEASENRPGAGIQATIDGHAWALGSPEFISSLGQVPDDQQQALIEGLRNKGHTVSLLADGRRLQAILSFTDPLRPGIDTMLAALRRNGIQHVTILSGDSQAAVDRIGRELGIDDCRGGLSPSDKMTWIQARQAAGHPVGMFGDGINDAPVLAAADVSLSFSDATDLANASSDFLLLGSDAGMHPGGLPAARHLAQRTRRNIIQNLSWAACYNLIAVPLAAAGWIPPWGAAIGMSASSLLVVVNALRLQKASTPTD